MRNIKELLASLTFLQCCIVTVIVLAIFTSSVQTGPVYKRQRRMSEIYSKLENSHQNETNFLDTCLHNGNQILRTSVTCEKRHGCRAIQKTGQCCPDYQCECQRDDKIYGNGEKLFDPKTPCRVCYCQGGEITCNQISCYYRNDCEPKYIPGRCCPEYDNCPPLENKKPETESTSTKDFTSSEFTVTDDGLENKISSDTTSSPISSTQKITTTTKAPTTKAPVFASTNYPPLSSSIAQSQEGVPNGNDNPLGIKIKEITKAEEIRITDDRKVNVMSYKDKTQTKVQIDENNSNAETSTRYSDKRAELINNLEHIGSDAGDKGTINVRNTNDNNKIYSSNLDSHESSTYGPESDNYSSEMNSPDRNNHRQTASRPFSTTTERIEIKHPPAIVQIGDKLVIVDHNQPKPITVIQVDDVEGLQRGEDDISYDQEMENERIPSGREQSKNMKIDKMEIEHLSTRSVDEQPIETVFQQPSEEIFDTQIYTEGPSDDFSSVFEVYSGHGIDLVGSGSEEYIIISSSASTISDQTTVNPFTSVSSEEGSTSIDTSVSPLTSQSQEASGDTAIETVFYTEGSSFSGETNEEGGKSSTTTESIATNSVTEEVPSAKEVPINDDAIAPPRKTFIEEDETQGLIHPGPNTRIPEDFSIHEEQNHNESKDMKILPEILEYRSNMTSTGLPPTSNDNNEVVHASEWLKESIARAPGEPHLIPEWERLNNTNSTSSEEDNIGGEYVPLKQASDEIIPEDGSNSTTIKLIDDEFTSKSSETLSTQNLDSLKSSNDNEDELLFVQRLTNRNYDPGHF